MQAKRPEVERSIYLMTERRSALPLATEGTQEPEAVNCVDGLYASERRDYPRPQQRIDTLKSFRPLGFAASLVEELPHAPERGGAFLPDRGGT